MSTEPRNGPFVERSAPAVPDHELAPPVASSAAVVDWSIALQTTFGDEKLLREIVETCLQETAIVLAQMQAALDAGDSAALRRGAHTIKGQMRIFAATDAERLAAQLEKRARDGDSRLSEPFALLQHQVARVEVELRDFLAGHGGRARKRFTSRLWVLPS